MSSSQGIPSSPMDIPITKQLIQERIDAGQIEQADIDLLKKGYRWMSLGTLIGGAVGLPAFILTGRVRPKMTMFKRLGLSILASSTTGFLGFTAAGAAAAWEVNSSMKNSTRKMQIFQQIMIDSRNAAEAERLGLPPPIRNFTPAKRVPTGDASVTGSGSPAFPAPRDEAFSSASDSAYVESSDNDFSSSLEKPTSYRTADMGRESSGGVWDPEREEKKVELEREREVQAKASGSNGKQADISEQVQAATGSVWDKLRRQATQSPATASQSKQTGTRQPPKDASPPLSEREREQAEFDRLVEKERSAVEDGFSEGKWK